MTAEIQQHRRQVSDNPATLLQHRTICFRYASTAQDSRSDHSGQQQNAPLTWFVGKYCHETIATRYREKCGSSRRVRLRHLTVVKVCCVWRYSAAKRLAAGSTASISWHSAAGCRSPTSAYLTLTCRPSRCCPVGVRSSSQPPPRDACAQDSEYRVESADGRRWGWV